MAAVAQSMHASSIFRKSQQLEQSNNGGRKQKKRFIKDDAGPKQQKSNTQSFFRNFYGNAPQQVFFKPLCMEEYSDPLVEQILALKKAYFVLNDRLSNRLPWRHAYAIRQVVQLQGPNDGPYLDTLAYYADLIVAICRKIKEEAARKQQSAPPVQTGDSFSATPIAADDAEKIYEDCVISLLKIIVRPLEVRSHTSLERHLPQIGRMLEAVTDCLFSGNIKAMTATLETLRELYQRSLQSIIALNNNNDAPPHTQQRRNTTNDLSEAIVECFRRTSVMRKLITSARNVDAQEVPLIMMHLTLISALAEHQLNLRLEALDAGIMQFIQRVCEFVLFDGRAAASANSTQQPCSVGTKRALLFHAIHILEYLSEDDRCVQQIIEVFVDEDTQLADKLKQILRRYCASLHPVERDSRNSLACILNWLLFNAGRNDAVAHRFKNSELARTICYLTGQNEMAWNKRSNSVVGDDESGGGGGDGGEPTHNNNNNGRHTKPLYGRQACLAWSLHMNDSNCLMKEMMMNMIKLMAQIPLLQDTVHRAQQMKAMLLYTLPYTFVRENYALHWPLAYYEHFQLFALDALAAMSPVYAVDYICLNGNGRLLQLLASVCATTVFSTHSTSERAELLAHHHNNIGRHGELQQESTIKEHADYLQHIPFARGCRTMDQALCLLGVRVLRRTLCMPKDLCVPEEDLPQCTGLDFICEFKTSQTGAKIQDDDVNKATTMVNISDTIRHDFCNKNGIQQLMSILRSIRHDRVFIACAINNAIQRDIFITISRLCCVSARKRDDLSEADHQSVRLFFGRHGGIKVLLRYLLLMFEFESRNDHRELVCAVIDCLWNCLRDDGTKCAAAENLQIFAAQRGVDVLLNLGARAPHAIARIVVCCLVDLCDQDASLLEDVAKWRNTAVNSSNGEEKEVSNNTNNNIISLMCCLWKNELQQQQRADPSVKKLNKTGDEQQTSKVTDEIGSQLYLKLHLLLKKLQSANALDLRQPSNIVIAAEDAIMLVIIDRYGDLIALKTFQELVCSMKSSNIYASLSEQEHHLIERISSVQAELNKNLVDVQQALFAAKDEHEQTLEKVLYQIMAGTTNKQP